MWGLNLALVTFNCSECQFKSSKNSKASTSRRTKMCPGTTMEKKIVREAFADMLPEAVAWRQKEQFSDGVGYSWIDTLKQITAEAVTDEQMAHAAECFPQGGVLLSLHLRRALPLRLSRPQCSQ